MKHILHAILYALLVCCARLPFAVIYGLSDITFVLLYYVVRYRRKVVDDNLKSSFPEKTDKERRQIARKFYRNFTDYIFETIKLLHISDKEMERRFTFGNTAVIDDFVSAGRSVAVYFSHCGNWEWAPSVTLHTSTPGVKYCQVYRPLRNKVFDRLMLHVRCRFGSVSFQKSKVFRDLFRLKAKGTVTVTGFMSDQKPSHGDPTFVTMFLNRPTAFITGTETLATRLGMAAIYWDMERVSRGHYRIACRLLDDGTHQCRQGELTYKYSRMLEQTIRRNPSIWLWSHKRWKYKVDIEQITQI